jgi:hypothetical protein
VNRGRGLHRQDPATKIPRLQAADHDVIRAARATLTGSADLSVLAPRVLDQKQTPTCWAHSAATLLYTRRHATLGGAPVLQSPLYFAQCLYGVYRAAATKPGDAFPLLADNGAQLDDGAKCFAQWGSSPFVGDGDSDMPDTDQIPEMAFSSVETGATVPFGGEFDIAVDGNAGDTCAASLEAKIPIWLGGPVGQNIQSYQAGQVEIPPDPDDPTIGGHARAVIGYKTVNGARLWLVRNSWGSSWGDAGNSWAEESVILGSWALLPFEVS